MTILEVIKKLGLKLFYRRRFLVWSGYDKKWAIYENIAPPNEEKFYKCIGRSANGTKAVKILIEGRL